MDLKISYNKPLNEKEWNELSLGSSNLLCSTHYDAIQSLYHQQAVYLQYFEFEKLIAGVKLYFWESKKIPFFFPLISRQLSQFGEYIIKGAYCDNDDLRDLITTSVRKFIKEKKAVRFLSGGFYGDDKLILNPFDSKNRTDFNVSIIDLTHDSDVLFANLHSKHRNVLRKALNSNLMFEKIDDINILISLINETYREQDKGGPSLEYLTSTYNILSKKGYCVLFAVKHGDEYLSVALIQIYGKIADYTFGGNKKNDLGAGQFLQWNIMNELKNVGIEKYSLGQTAIMKNEDNIKFSKGISDFKIRFGTKEYKCFKQTSVLKPFNLKLFLLIQKIYNLWK